MLYNVLTEFTSVQTKCHRSFVIRRWKVKTLLHFDFSACKYII